MCHACDNDDVLDGSHVDSSLPLWYFLSSGQFFDCVLLPVRLYCGKMDVLTEVSFNCMSVCDVEMTVLVTVRTLKLSDSLCCCCCDDGCRDS